MITLGPFRIHEIDKLREVLEARGAQHEFIADEDLRDRLMAEHHESATTLGPRATAGKLDLRYIFIEIEDAEFQKVATEFEKFGIMAPSDGSWELAEED